MSPEILFVIAARGGSKGLPRKNLKKVAGLSLIGFKARSAWKSKYCTRLIISTDDTEIQDEARLHGVEVPFTRPAELAIDTASSDSVVEHVIRYIEEVEGRSYDAILLLEPPSPFARASDYDAAVEMFVDREAALVVGVRPVEVSTIFQGPLGERGEAKAIVEKFSGLKDLRRQAMTPEYTMNGALYLIDWNRFGRTGRIYGDPAGTYGYVMDRYHSVEIETPHDLALAEFMIERGLVDIKEWQ